MNIPLVVFLWTFEILKQDILEICANLHSPHKSCHDIEIFHRLQTLFRPGKFQEELS
jgi:hypothetical protein